MSDKEFKPIPGAFGYRLSNPPVLCMAALLGSLELFEEATMPRLRNKSVQLTGYMDLLIKRELGNYVSCLTPSNIDQRGCQLSLSFKEDVSSIALQLEDEGIVCDVRKPNVLRVSPTPLYNSFLDVWTFVSTLKRIISKD